MIFLWAAFFLRTDLEKQIVPLACQLQIWAVALPDLFRTGSVPFLLGKHSPSLMLTESESGGQAALTPLLWRAWQELFTPPFPEHSSKAACRLGGHSI